MEMSHNEYEEKFFMARLAQQTERPQDLMQYVKPLMLRKRERHECHQEERFLYSQVFKHHLAPRLNEIKLDKTLAADAKALAASSAVLTEKTAPSPAAHLAQGMSGDNAANVNTLGQDGKFMSRILLGSMAAMP